MRRLGHIIQSKIVEDVQVGVLVLDIEFALLRVCLGEVWLEHSYGLCVAVVDGLCGD